MKAAVFHAPGDIRRENVPGPRAPFAPAAVCVTVPRASLQTAVDGRVSAA